MSLNIGFLNMYLAMQNVLQLIYYTVINNFNSGSDEGDEIRMKHKIFKEGVSSLDILKCYSMAHDVDNIFHSFRGKINKEVLNTKSKQRNKHL